KTTVVTGVGLLIAAAMTMVTMKEIQQHRTYPWQTRQYDYRLLDTAKPQLAILPSKYGAQGGFGSSLGGIMGVGEPAASVVEAAYDWYRIPRIVLETNLPPGSFDFIASGSNRKTLKDEVARKFGVVAKVETRNSDVWLLKMKSANAPGLKPSAGFGQTHVEA